MYPNAFFPCSFTPVFSPSLKRRLTVMVRQACVVPLQLSLLLGELRLLAPAHAEMYFDPNALDVRLPGQNVVDLSIFSAGEQLPGTYRVDVYLNKERIDTRNVTFVQGGKRLVPILRVADLAAMGVNTAAFPALAMLQPEETVIDLGKYIPQADSTFDFNHQRLDLSVPQAALNFQARNAVDPSLWDQGLTAFLMNYNATGSNTQQRNGRGDSSNAYLNLRTGLNIGPWRLRNNTVYSNSRSTRDPLNENNVLQTQTLTQESWQNINTYAQRDIQRLKGQLTLGETTTSGNVFDSVPFLGVQLASDDNMLPDSLRGFAPVVHGIARSNAQVTVRQNGYIIYQRYVAPGAFTLQDLYPTSSSGDLTVTVRENDGSESTFVQPFSAVPVMQREGHWRYALTGGEYRTTSADARTPTFLQPSIIYGVSNTLTLYGGTQLAGKYQAALLGIGQGLGHLGSLSLDITQARTTLRDDSTHQGQSYRIQYAKDVFQSGTTFTLAGYRYSTSGFYDFREANEVDLREVSDWSQRFTKRNKIQIQVSQSLAEYGNLYINAYQQDYWRLSGQARTVNAGYNVNVNGVSYGLNFSEAQTPQNRNDRQVTFNVQVSLSNWLNNAWANYNIQYDNHGKSRQQVGISGLALEDSNLSYALNESYGNQGEGTAGNLSATYKGSIAQVNGGYNYSQNSQQMNYGIEGGVLVHPYGVTLAQSLGDSIVLVRAPGADDVRVQNQAGIYTDSRGYAVVPYVGTYRKNQIALDTSTLGDKVDLDGAVKMVVPTAGAVVLADFKTQLGARALIALSYQGKPVPFGATASLSGEGQTSAGIVGDGGSVYLAGVPATGAVRVMWGSGPGQSCVASFALPASSSGNVPVINLSAVCQ
ncbi:MAG: fimbria/pilus outer membrane usher protein [Yersinia sp. (in: enterobacteria)]